MFVEKPLNIARGREKQDEQVPDGSVLCRWCRHVGGHRRDESDRFPLSWNGPGSCQRCRLKRRNRVTNEEVLGLIVIIVWLAVVAYCNKDTFTRPE